MENKNLKVVITRGLPASGKTSFAKQWVAEDPELRTLIEKDQIRKNSRLFKDGVYNHKRGDESIVIRERDRLIRQALGSGSSVVSSDTNLSRKHLNQITNIANEFKAEVEVVDFLDVPIKELLRRDAQREHSVGEQVIRSMFHQQVKKMPTFLNYDVNLPWVVVCDMDGTLTKGPKGRSPYEWKKVGNDDINLGVSHLLDGVTLIKHAKLFIFSGRDSVCRPETEDWLERHDIEYDLLEMRAEGDTRSDEIVKAEMIEKHIRDKYNILIWFDDRVGISTMLRDVYGINVAQIGDPYYRF